MMHESCNVTQILRKVETGDSQAAEDLLPLIYDELRRVAAEKLRRETPGQTLQPTALVHEAWIRMVDVSYGQSWSSRRHFFAAASEAMRRILVDNARRKNRQKRGSEWHSIAIPLDEIPDAEDDNLLESLDAALQRLQQVDPTACELVKLRYFAGLSLREASTALEMPPRTADRLWAYAKAWLLRELRGDDAENC